MATVTFYGVRGSCPCSDAGTRRYGGATACVAVQPDGDVPPVVLDLGTGCRTLGDELVGRYFPGEGLTAGATEGPKGATAASTPARLTISAFVTHLHFDHVQGLPFFGPALRQAAVIDLYGPSQDGGAMEKAFAEFVRPPYFPVTLEQLPGTIRLHQLADGEEVLCDGAKVTGREVAHVGRTLGYRVECDGIAVAYLGDHQAPKGEHREGSAVPDAALDLARQCDLLVHDAQYTDEEFEVRAHWGHSTVRYAVEVARASGAKRLALFHHDPTHDDDLLDRIGLEASRLAGAGLEVFVASENMTVKIGG